MSVEERDPHTGYLTTGHEWNGIKELNTPVPRLVYIFLIAAALFSLGYWILFPAWPLGSTYTKGVLGVDQKQLVTDSLKEAALDRATWTGQIQQKSFADIQADPALMTVVRETGHRLFGDNCSACHGHDAKGNTGFPNLTTSSWLWGGKPEEIFETIRVGINSTHPQSRVAQMLAFGRDGMLQRPDIDAVVAYVRSLSDMSLASDKPTADKITAGKTVFANNCASCHGPDAKGNPAAGIPNLTDPYWIYGGDEQTIFASVWGGRQGHMPTWEGRLSEVDRKILTLYLLDLRKPQ